MVGLWRAPRVEWAECWGGEVWIYWEKVRAPRVLRVAGFLFFGEELAGGTPFGGVWGMLPDGFADHVHQWLRECFGFGCFGWWCVACCAMQSVGGTIQVHTLFPQLLDQVRNTHSAMDRRETGVFASCTVIHGRQKAMERLEKLASRRCFVFGGDCCACEGEA